jgi:hypothetical protein
MGVTCAGIKKPKHSSPGNVRIVMAITENDDLKALTATCGVLANFPARLLWQALQPYLRQIAQSVVDPCIGTALFRDKRPESSRQCIIFIVKAVTGFKA